MDGLSILSTATGEGERIREERGGGSTTDAAAVATDFEIDNFLSFSEDSLRAILGGGARDGSFGRGGVGSTACSGC